MQSKGDSKITVLVIDSLIKKSDFLFQDKTIKFLMHFQKKEIRI